jgi:hypothetical protein
VCLHVLILELLNGFLLYSVLELQTYIFSGEFNLIYFNFCSQLSVKASNLHETQMELNGSLCRRLGT